MAIPGQSAKLNIRQSVFVAKSPNLISVKCTTPTVYPYHTSPSIRRMGDFQILTLGLNFLHLAMHSCYA